MAIDAFDRAVRHRLPLVPAFLLLPVLLASCTQQVDCEAEVPWVDSPDLAFTGRVTSTDTQKATFQVEDIQLGREGFLVDIAYPEPGLLHRETEYEVRAVETAGEPEFESSVYCGATRRTDGEAIDTSWLTTMRARLPSTPAMLLVMIVLFVTLVGGAVVGFGILDRRLRQRYRSATDEDDDAGNAGARSSDG